MRSKKYKVKILMRHWISCYLNLTGVAIMNKGNYGGPYYDLFGVNEVHGHSIG